MRELASSKKMGVETYLMGLKKTTLRLGKVAEEG